MLDEKSIIKKATIFLDSSLKAYRDRKYIIAIAEFKAAAALGDIIEDNWIYKNLKAACAQNKIRPRQYEDDMINGTLFNILPEGATK